jgi:hypothetical protein
MPLCKKRESIPKTTRDVETRVITLACSEPSEGYAKWIVRLLAGGIELNYVDSPSHTGVNQFF